MLRRISPFSLVYAFGAAWMGVILMPVYTPFLLARGLTAGDALGLQSVYSVVVLLLDIPTGYLCDRFGRRRTILAGTVFNLIGWILFAVVRGFPAYAMAEAILAVGWTLVAGSDIALLLDMLTERGATGKRREDVLTHYVTAQVLGEAALGLLGSALASVSLRAVGLATIAEAVMPIIIATLLPPDTSRADAVTTGEIRAATKRLFQVPGLSLVFVNNILWSVATFVAVWLLQPYWMAQGVGLGWFGLLWAGTLLTVSVTGQLARRVPRGQTQAGAMLILTLAPVLAYAGMAALGGFAGIAAGYLFYASRGLNSVRLVHAFNQQVPGHLRATFNSLRTCAFRLVYLPIGLWARNAVDAHGVRWTSAVLAVAFALAFGLFGLPLVRRPPAA